MTASTAAMDGRTQEVRCVMCASTEAPKDGRSAPTVREGAPLQTFGDPMRRHVTFRGSAAAPVRAALNAAGAIW